MRNRLTTIVTSLIMVLLLVVVAVIPLLFLNVTTEFYDIPKLIFLGTITLLLYGLWIISWMLQGRVSLTRTPLDIPLLLLLATAVIATALTGAKYPAIFGNLPVVHGSLIAWITYILFYFVLASHLKNLASIRILLITFYCSAIVATILTLLSFFHMFLPFDFANSVNFTPTGSSFSTIALLLLLLPAPLLSLLRPNRYFPLPFALAISILFTVTVTLLSSLSGLVVLLLVICACLLVARPKKNTVNLALFFLPVIFGALTLAFAYLPLPNGLNTLQRLEASFPKEIQLPLGTSWRISASTFRDSPFFGTGPSSYLFNFTSYKPAEFNQQRFWNLSFSSAHNEFLQILGTLGLFGLLSFVLLCFVIFIVSRRSLAASTQDSPEAAILSSALGVSGLVTLLLFAIHATTLVSLVGTLCILAMLMLAQKPIRDRVTVLAFRRQKEGSGENLSFDMLPFLIFVVYLAVAGFLILQGQKVIMADYYHRLALTQADKNGALTYEYLQKAESLNPFIDIYRVDMAQTNLALANALASKGAASGSQLTDTEKKTVQTLLIQAVNEGRASVTLSPRSSRNWEVLGTIYRSLTGIADNTSTFALDAYGQAIQRNPLNPTLRVNVGGVYYSIKNYDLAVRFFSDAINLKPDYTNAYFNLALTLRDKGDLENAKAVTEQLLRLVENDKAGQDYQTASALMQDITKRIASGTKPESKSPAQNPLEKSDVTVPNLDNPPSEVATPAAIKPNPTISLPEVSPTPTATP